MVLPPAAVPSRQVLVWSLPTVAFVLSILWYRRRYRGSKPQTDPGGTLDNSIVESTNKVEAISESFDSLSLQSFEFKDDQCGVVVVDQEQEQQQQQLNKGQELSLSSCQVGSSSISSPCGEVILTQSKIRSELLSLLTDTKLEDSVLISSTTKSECKIKKQDTQNKEPIVPVLKEPKRER